MTTTSRCCSTRPSTTASICAWESATPLPSTPPAEQSPPVPVQAAELAELAGLYRVRGLAPGVAWQVAEQLTAHDPLAAHAEAELGIDPQQLTSPLLSMPKW